MLFSIAAKRNEKAVSLVEEPKEEITLARNIHLLCDKVHLHLLKVLFENPLNFELQDFQKVAIHVLGSGQNFILVSPKGSGKMLVVYLLSGYIGFCKKLMACLVSESEPSLLMQSCREK